MEMKFKHKQLHFTSTSLSLSSHISAHEAMCKFQKRINLERYKYRAKRVLNMLIMEKRCEGKIKEEIL